MRFKISLGHRMSSRIELHTEILTLNNQDQRNVSVGESAYRASMISEFSHIIKGETDSQIFHTLTLIITKIVRG